MHARLIVIFVALCFMLVPGCSEQAPAAPPQPELSALFLGDSYTFGTSVDRDRTFPMQLKAELEADGYAFRPLMSVAFTGYTTDELIEAMQSLAPPVARRYDFVTLLIGVNNQVRGLPVEQYETEFKHLLDRAIAYADGEPKRVIVISIPDYTRSPRASAATGASEEIDILNAISQRLAEEAGTRYVNVTDISRQDVDPAAWFAGDQLHPSEKQYEAWVQRILPEAREILDTKREAP